MIGFQDGGIADTGARERSSMADARQRWPFLTHCDASTIRNEPQPTAIVKDRSGRSRPQAEAEVRPWTSGKLLR